MYLLALSNSVATTDIANQSQSSFLLKLNIALNPS